MHILHKPDVHSILALCLLIIKMHNDELQYVCDFCGLQLLKQAVRFHVSIRKSLHILHKSNVHVCSSSKCTIMNFKMFLICYWFQSLKQVVLSYYTNQSIQDYANVIIEYVRLYGGGSDADMLHFVDQFSKRYNKTIKLGSEFWHALVDWKPASSSLCPFTRAALMATTFISPRNKINDGFGKLITKTDIKKLERKD